MKIGWVVPGGFDPSGQQGTIPALTGLAQQLARDHDLRIFAAAGRSGAGRYRASGAEVTQVGRDGRRIGALARWLAAAPRFDVLHAFWADRTALLAGLFARARGVPVVVSLGGGELVWLPDIRYGGAGTARGRAVSRSALRLAAAITAGTSFIARKLPADLVGRAEIIPLGADVARFEAPPARPPGPPWRLLHVANLNPVKDQTTLLAALRRLVDRVGDVHLDCVGEDALDGAVQRRADGLGLAGHVTFHGFVPPAALPAFYRRAHLHVLSSRHESQGVVVLEAAAAGLPTAGTAVGLIDTLAPAAARAVPVGDGQALADAIAALLADPTARLALGAAAQRFARTHDVAWTARAFDAIYARLVARSR